MNTSQNDSFPPDPHAPTDIRKQGSNIRLFLVISLIAFMAFVGNILVVAAVFLSRRLRVVRSNLFIVNLSATDLLSVSVVMVSSLIAVGFDRWPMGRAWCSIVCGANYCFIIVSMLTLALISIDRFIAIHHPLRYRVLVKKQTVLVLIAYTWLQGFAFGLVPILYGWVEYDYWEVTCAIEWHGGGKPVLTYVIVAFALCFMLPAVVLTISYSTILRTATNLKPLPEIKPIPQGSAEVPRKKSYSTERSKHVRSLLIVVLAFFICMTPFSITKLYKVIAHKDHHLPKYVNILATVFQFLGSAVNPCIYTLFLRDFRMAFLQILSSSTKTRDSEFITSHHVIMAKNSVLPVSSPSYNQGSQTTQF